MSAEIVEACLDLALDVIIGGPGDENAAGLGNPFETRRDVDALAIEIAALDHNVAEIDPNAQHDLAILWLIVVCGRHAVLQIDGALHGVDCAAKLDQHTISSNFENPALMLGNEGLKHLLPPGLKRSQRIGFVLLHQPAVANDIGGQYRGKATSLFGHWGCLPKLGVRDFIGPRFGSLSVRMGAPKANVNGDVGYVRLVPATKLASADASFRCFSSFLNGGQRLERSPDIMACPIDDATSYTGCGTMTQFSTKALWKTLCRLLRPAQPFENAVAAYQRQDYATALKLLTPLAMQGNASAKHNLGVMYRDGQGVPEDRGGAVQWFLGRQSKDSL